MHLCRYLNNRFAHAYLFISFLLIEKQSTRWFFMQVFTEEDTFLIHYGNDTHDVYVQVFIRNVQQPNAASCEIERIFLKFASSSFFRL